MVTNRPRWEYKLTHVPTGLEIVRTSHCHRHQHHARESAKRYLKALLVSDQEMLKKHMEFAESAASGTVIEEIIEIGGNSE